MMHEISPPQTRKRHLSGSDSRPAPHCELGVRGRTTSLAQRRTELGAAIGLKLIGMDASQADQIALPFGRYLVGSGESCDLRLTSNGVESRHALLLIGQARNILKAFSRHTLINQGPVTESQISVGDRLTIGSTEWRVEILVEETATGLESRDAPGASATQPEAGVIDLEELLQASRPSSPVAEKRQQEALPSDGLTDSPLTETSTPIGSATPSSGAAEDAENCDSEGGSEEALAKEQRELKMRAARLEAQRRQLNVRSEELDMQAEMLRSERENLNEIRAELNKQQRVLDESKVAWKGKCRNREKFLEEFERRVSSRVQEVEHEESRLTSWSRKLHEQEHAVEDTLRQIEAQRQTVEDAAEQAERERAAAEARSKDLESRELQLEAARQELQEIGLQLKQREQDLEAREDRLHHNPSEPKSAHEHQSVLESMPAPQKSDLLQDLQMEEETHDGLYLAEPEDFISPPDVTGGIAETAAAAISSDGSQTIEKVSRISQLDRETRLATHAQKPSAAVDVEDSTSRTQPVATASTDGQAADRTEDRDAILARWLGNSSTQNYDDEDQESTDAFKPGPQAGSSSGSRSETGLRSQLAEMFGITADQFRQTDDAAPQVENSTGEASLQPDDFENSVAEVEAQSELPTLTNAPAVLEDAEDENAIASYMQGLLARTRNRDGATASEPVPPPRAPQQTVDPVAAIDDPAPEEPVRKARKLDHVEKESIRADFQSFRELANQSARSAVTKSNVDRKASHLQTLSIWSGCGWLITGGMLSAEVWGGMPQRIPALLCAVVSGTLSVLAALRYREICNLGQGLEADESAQDWQPEERLDGNSTADPFTKSPANEIEEEAGPATTSIPAPSAGKSGKLRFM